MKGVAFLSIVDDLWEKPHAVYGHLPLFVPKMEWIVHPGKQVQGSLLFDATPNISAHMSVPLIYVFVLCLHGWIGGSVCFCYGLIITHILAVLRNNMI